MIRLMQIIQCNKSEHQFFTLAKQKKPGTNTELSILFSCLASRFFSADIDGDDPLCYDMGSRKGKRWDYSQSNAITTASYFLSTRVEKNNKSILFGG